MANFKTFTRNLVNSYFWENYSELQYDSLQLRFFLSLVLDFSSSCCLLVQIFEAYTWEHLNIKNSRHWELGWLEGCRISHAHNAKSWALWSLTIELYVIMRNDHHFLLQHALYLTLLQFFVMTDETWLNCCTYFNKSGVHKITSYEIKLSLKSRI